jgi:hypothetical protein
MLACAVGNLAIGVVTGDMLKELFNTIMANQVADPVNAPPVVNVNIDASGAERSPPAGLLRGPHWRSFCVTQAASPFWSSEPRSSRTTPCNWTSSSCAGGP